MIFLDRIVVATVVGAVWYAALALGATHASAFVPLEAAIFTLPVLWVTRLRRSRLSPPSLLRSPIGAVVAPLFGFVLWAAFEAVPLPPSLVRAIAPPTYQVYQRVFPDFPEAAPYSAPTRPVSLRIRPAPTILPTVAETATGAAVPFRAQPRESGGLEPPAPEPFSIDALRWRSLSLAPSSTRRAWLKLTACTALFLVAALFPFGAGDKREGNDRDFMRLFFKALVLIAMFEGLAGAWGSVSHNRMVLELLRPLEWSPLTWGSRATGTFANPDHFAFFMNLAFPACLAGVIAPAAFVRRTDRNPYRLFCATASLLVMSALLLSGSRAGWASAAVGVAFLTCLLRRADKAGAPDARSRQWIGAGAALALLMSASVMYVGSEGRGLVHARLQTGAGEINWRVTPVIDSLPMVARFPVFGIGLGAWPDLFRGYQRPPWSQAFYNAAHDDGLQLVAETGIIGFGLFGLALGAAVRALRRGFESATGDEWVYLAAAAAPVPGALLHELIDFSLQTPANAILLSALLGVGIRIAWKRRPAREMPASGYTPAQKISMQLGIVAALSLAGIAACQDRRAPHPHELQSTASVQKVRSALLRHPADSRVHLLMAEKMKAAMLPALESRELRTALYLEPANPHAHDRYAQILAEQGRVSDALREVSRSLYYAPSFSSHPYLSQRLIGWLSPAEREAILLGLNRATARQFPGAAVALGAFYSAIGEPRASANAYMQAAALEALPLQRMSYWVRAGRGFAAAGEFDRAAAVLREAIRTDGHCNEPYQAMIAAVLVPTGRFEQARRLIAQGSHDGADPAGLYLALAEAEEKQARRADAEADLRKGIESEPASFACMERLGRLYLGDKNYGEAIRWLRRAAGMRPDSPEALFSLALAQDGAYDYAGADISYARAVALAPDDAEFRARYRAFQRKMVDNSRPPALVP